MAQYGVELRESRPGTWTQCRQRGGSVAAGQLVMLDLAGADPLTDVFSSAGASNKPGTQATASSPLATVLAARAALSVGRVGVAMAAASDDGLGYYEFGETGDGRIAPVVVDAYVLVDAGSVRQAGLRIGDDGTGAICLTPTGAGAVFAVLLEACTTDDGKGPSATINKRKVLLYSEGRGVTTGTGSSALTGDENDVVTVDADGNLTSGPIERSNFAQAAGMPGIRPGADLRNSTAYAKANWAPTDGTEFELEFSIYGYTAYGVAGHGVLGRQSSDHAVLQILTTGVIQLQLNTTGIVVATAAAAMPVDGMAHTIVGGLSGGTAYIKLDRATIASAASAGNATEVAAEYYINYDGLSSRKLGGVLYDCTFRDLALDTNTFTWRCDEQVSPFANSHATSAAKSMVWTGFFPQADIATVTGKPFVAPTARPRWYTTFDATTSWGAASGGYYTISIPQTTHNIPAPRRVTVWEGTTDLDIVFPDRIRVTSAGAVEIRVTDSPDERFAGALEIG